MAASMYLIHELLGNKPASCTSIRLVLIQSFAHVPMHLCNTYMNGAVLVSYTKHFKSRLH